MGTSTATVRQPRRSIKTQLIIGTVLSLTIVLVLFGVFVRYVVATTLLSSVDSDLSDRLVQFRHRPPPPGGPNGAGPPPFGGGGSWPLPPPGQRIPPGQQDFGAPPPILEPPENPGPQQPSDQPNGVGLDQNPGQDLGPPFAIRNGAFGRDRRFPDIPNRVREFDSSGTTVDGDDNLHAWDLAALKEASQTNDVIYTTIRSGGQDIRLATQELRHRGGGSTIMQAPYPLAPVEAAIGGVDRALLILVPIAMIIAAVGGALVTNSVVKRVGQMVSTAGQIGASDLSQRLIVTGRDEFAELAETFNALLDRVEDAFHEQERIVEQRRRFTADASHELKTPLTVIRGTTSLALIANGGLDRQSTLEIDSAAASMSELVQDLIFLARSDAGQLGHERIDLLLAEPLQRAIGRISTISKAPITFVKTQDNLTINANESEMVRLFSNIINNASLHTPIDGRIEVNLSGSSRCVVVTVSDTGVGIAPQHIAHLGERFYRVDESRTRTPAAGGGSGLGLAICLGIVEAHRGTISFNSFLGKGTTVTITLPCSTPDER